MDFNFIIENIPKYLEAMKLTVFIGIFGIIFSILIGIVCALVLYYRVPAARQIVSIYIELSRNTPLVIQLFFLYFGLPKIGITFNSYVCAVIGLSFLGGSYMCEAFRSGLESVSKGQRESGLSIGLTESQLITNVILPQAFTVSFPAIAANIIFLLKETSVIGILALMELMYLTRDLIGLYYKTNESLFMLVAAYLIIILPVSFVLTVIERRIRYATVGN